MGTMMTNINDFISWWRGFRDGVDPANITKEHLDIIERKINGLQELWDISLPTLEEREEVIPWPNPIYGWPYVGPKVAPLPYSPRVPDIWCRENQQYPRVGTPEGFGTPRHVN
jgi:hypothetical protein